MYISTVYMYYVETVLYYILSALCINFCFSSNRLFHMPMCMSMLAPLSQGEGSLQLMTLHVQTIHIAGVFQVVENLWFLCLGKEPLNIYSRGLVLLQILISFCHKPQFFYHEYSKFLTSTKVLSLIENALCVVSTAEILWYLSCVVYLYRSLGNISVLFGQTVKGMSAGARVFEYIDLRPLIPLKGGVVVPHDKLRGKVEFNNVTFEYPCRPGQVSL